MRRLILALTFLLVGAINAQAQSTTVSGNVTDSGSQAWAGGTYQFQFTPNPLFPTGPYTWSGGTLNKIISGTLDGSGNYSVSIPSNSAISPQGSTWILQVTPNATSPSSSTAKTIITGGTQTLNATPPAIATPATLFARAYQDAEIAGATQGSQYFNVTSLNVRVCTAVTGLVCSTWANVGSGGGGGSPGGANTDIQFNNAGTFGGVANLTFNTSTNSLTKTGGITSFDSITGGPTNSNGLTIDGSSTGTVALFGTESGSTVSLGADAGILMLSTTGGVQFGAVSKATPIVMVGSTSGTFQVSTSPTASQLNFGSNANVTSAGALTVTSCTGCGGGSSAFSSLTSGTNTAAAMVVGSGASLNFTGSGTNNASSLGGATFAAPGAIGGGTAGAGTFTTLTANTSLTINGGTAQTGTQGTDTKLLTAGTVSGTGVNLCTDASGGATTTGCTTGGSGTVTSVSFTGGLISVATPTTTPALTVAGTSGGIPYFSSASTWASSALLTSNVLIKGGGAGAAPSNSLLTDNGTTLTYTGTGGISSAPSGGIGGTLTLPEGTTATASTGNDVVYADSTSHVLKASLNNGSFLNIPLFSGSFTSGHCLQVSGTVNLIVDSGSTNCGGAAGVSSFTGDGTFITNSASTGAVTTTLGNAGADKWWGNNTGSTAAPGYESIGTQDVSPNYYAAGAGTAQAQTVTLTPAATSLATGLKVHWTPTAANTAAAPTLAVNGLTAKNITKCGTTALVANDLTTTAVAVAIYDGTQFELQNPQATGCAAQQVFFASNATAAVPSGTQFIPFTATLALNAAEAVTQVTMPRSGVVTSLFVRLTAAEGAAATLAVTLRKGGADQAITCTVGNSATTCNDTAHTVSFAQGDLLNFKTVQTGTGTSQLVYISGTFY